MNIHKIYNVAVLLSTYNGQRFLKEQIESIINQNGVNVYLFIRDDGSEDKTQDIIKECANLYNNVYFLNENKVEHIGICHSFLYMLLEIINNQKKEMDFYSFSDQDDVWKIDKLLSAVQQIERESVWHDEPVLYYSNKTFVDKNLILLSEENIRYYGNFFESFLSNKASGCTMVFNRIMGELATKHIPEYKGFLHDSWIFRLAKSCNVKIVFDRSSYILYRQHGGNVCGVGALKTIDLKGITHILHPPKRGLSRQLKEIYDRYEDCIGDSQRNVIMWILTYRNNIKSWLHLIFYDEAIHSGIIIYTFWLLKLILFRI